MGNTYWNFYLKHSFFCKGQHLSAYVHVCIANCTFGTSSSELIIPGTGVNIRTGLWDFHAQTSLTLKMTSLASHRFLWNASMSPCVVDFTQSDISTVSDRNCKDRGRRRQYFGKFVHCQILKIFSRHLTILNLGKDELNEREIIPNRQENRTMAQENRFYVLHKICERKQTYFWRDLFLV